MTCPNCQSLELVFVESKRDSSVVGGHVNIYRCSDCNEITEDVPPEVVDEIRDKEACD